MTATLTLACIDSDALPLFGLAHEDGTREGYEPEVGALVARALGLVPRWVLMPWDAMAPAVRDHRVDAVLCGQGITAERQRVLDYSTPYAIFDETVLVRADEPASGPEDFAGARVAAIAGSTNIRVVDSLPGAIPVPFSGGDDVFGDMIAALREGRVDALVDDDVVTVPLGDDPDLRVAFTAPTHNRWGIGIAKDRPDLLGEIDRALAALTADGSLAAAWERWMPHLPFPFQAAPADAPAAATDGRTPDGVETTEERSRRG
ncbi:MAG: ABC transporter glutamine-binding protein GlnH [Pseudoclavibacter caeni]|jgi:polar amino acid transport system substrate-binding protein